MTAKEIQTRIGTLAWNLNFYDFVKQILQADPREGDVWQLEMWQNWKQLAKAVGRFDAENLDRILFE